MTTSFLTQAKIIEGKLVSTVRPKLISQRGLARISVRQGLSLPLRQAKIIIRPSGKRSHLSRYLIGICAQTGILIEVFLERVDGLKGLIFQTKARINQGLIRQLSKSLSPQQTLDMLF
ncbi:MAG: hypothetical protein AAF629_00340 [Chloroflexota bacterium]